MDPEHEEHPKFYSVGAGLSAEHLNDFSGILFGLDSDSLPPSTIYPSPTWSVPPSPRAVSKASDFLSIKPRTKGKSSSVVSCNSDREQPHGGRNRSFDEVNFRRRLACPFAKIDCVRFSPANNNEKNFRGCSGCVLRKIANVKNHLARVHAEPRFFCTNCFSAFPTSDVLQQHRSAIRKCQAASRPFVSAAQLEAIGGRRGKVRNPAQTWYEIFDILFGTSQQRPLDPYASSMSDSFAASYELLRDVQRTFRLRLSTMPGISPETKGLVEQALADTASEVGGKMWREMTMGALGSDTSRRSSNTLVSEPKDLDMDEYVDFFAEHEA